MRSANFAIISGAAAGDMTTPMDLVLGAANAPPRQSSGVTAVRRTYRHSCHHKRQLYRPRPGSVIEHGINEVFHGATIGHNHLACMDNFCDTHTSHVDTENFAGVTVKQEFEQAILVISTMSRSTNSISRSRLSTRVTSTPRVAKIEAYSQPTLPTAMTYRKRCCAGHFLPGQTGARDYEIVCLLGRRAAP